MAIELTDNSLPEHGRRCAHCARLFSVYELAPDMTRDGRRQWIVPAHISNPSSSLYCAGAGLPAVTRIQE